jgi:hypothetical protein
MIGMKLTCDGCGGERFAFAIRDASTYEMTCPECGLRWILVGSSPLALSPTTSIEVRRAA